MTTKDIKRMQYSAFNQRIQKRAQAKLIKNMFMYQTLIWHGKIWFTHKFIIFK